VSKGARSTRREKVLRLMAEAGVSPARVRVERVLGSSLRVLAGAGIALIVVGIVVGTGLVWIGVALFGGSLVLGAAIGWTRLRTIDKIRWQDGVVTFRRIEPGEVSENGQHVVCEVELNSPRRAARVAATVGPLDVERLVVGATMRCRIDHLEFPIMLLAYPYAKPDAPLPSGRELAFRKA
jgi:hypothetical protein